MLYYLAVIINIDIGTTAVSGRRAVLLSNNYQYRTRWESNPNWSAYLHCRTACELEGSRSLIDHRYMLCLNNDLSRHVNWLDYNRFNRFLTRKSCLIMLAQLLQEEISLYLPYYLEHTHRGALIIILHISNVGLCYAPICQCGLTSGLRAFDCQRYGLYNL